MSNITELKNFITHWFNGNININISDGYVNIYVAIEQMSYEIFQSSYIWHSMLASMFQLVVYIYKRSKTIFPTTMLAFMLPLNQWFITVYNGIISNIQY